MFEIPFNLLIYVNFVLIIWFLVDLYRGYKRGLLLQILDWVSTFVALFVAWLFSNPFAQAFPWFYSAKGIGVASIDAAIALQVNRLVWLLILFVGLRLLMLLLTPLAGFISKMPLIKQVNSSIGGVSSVLLFGVKLILVTFFLTFPIVKNGQEVIDASVLKHVEKLTLPLFEMMDSTISSNTALQSIINHQELDATQTENMVEWLRGLNFSTNEIMEYLDRYE